MKLKQIFLLLTVTLLLIGIVSATEITDNSTIKDNPNKLITPKEVEKSNINTHIPNKHINKKNIINKTTKTATKTYDINNFNDLHHVLTNNSNKNLNINIKSDIQLKNDIDVNENIKSLIINGNNKTINGNNKYQFLYINSRSTVSINNILIKNCKSYHGGAIFTGEYTKLNINSSTFLNNKAESDGGAIKSYFLTINNCKFVNNTAGSEEQFEFRGGAVFVFTKLTAINCSFINNTCSGDGGAIYGESVIVKDCTLRDNDAYLGGAIYCGGYLGKSHIINSLFTGNSGSNAAGAIFAIDDINVRGNKFISNTASGDSGALYFSDSINKINVYNNFFRNNSALYSLRDNKDPYTEDNVLNILESVMISSNNGDGFINNNIFNDKIPKTNVSLAYSTNDENLKINGVLTSNGKSLSNQTVKINIEGKVFDVKTDINGRYDYTYDMSNLSANYWNNTHIIFVLFDGNGNYNPSGAVTYFKLKRIKTHIDIIKITQKNSKSNMTILGKFTSNSGKLLINTKLKLNINGKNVIVKTDKNALFKYTFKPNINTLNKIKVTFLANTNYPYSGAKITKIFNKTTKLTLKKVVNKSKITFTGTFYSVSGKKLINSKLKIKVNGSVKTIKTNSKGIYSYTMNNPGKKLKVQVYYNEKSKYHYAPTSITKIL